MNAHRSGRLAAVALLAAACQAIFGIGDTELERRGAGASAGDAGTNTGGQGGSASALGDGGSQAGMAGEGGAGVGAEGGAGASAGGSAGHGDSGGTDDVGGAGADGGDSGRAGTGAGIGGSAGAGGAGMAGSVGAGGSAGAGGAGMAGSAAGGNAGTGGTAERIFRARFTWPFDPLAVCIQVQSDADATLRDAQLVFGAHVRDLVEGTWGRYADIAFWDWYECGPVDKLVVELTTTDPSSSGLGYPGFGTHRTITLNTAASDAEILYFWGRALGFEHEFGRDAYQGECIRCTSHDDCVIEDRRSCLPSGFCGNPLDQQSIMAAPDCGGIASTRALTVFDVVGAQRAYGRKHRGAVVDHRGRCLFSNFERPQPGDAIRTYPCVPFDTQRWERSFANVSGESDWLRLRDQDLCAQASGPVSAVPSPLVQAVCSRTAPGQDIRSRSVLLRVLGNQCVVTDSDAPGSPLLTRECGGSGFERWLVRDGRIELSGTGRCATVVGGQADLAARLALADCNQGSIPQRFEFRPGEIWYFDAEGDHACLAVYGGLSNSGAEGAAIALWNGCGFNQENFLFHTTGTFETAGGCFDFVDGYSRDYGAVGVATCDPSSRQEWDYYW